MTFATPSPQVPRDRWGRPLIIPPDGGKPVAYQRASGFDVLDDRYNLERWGKRMVALGVAERADLLLAISAHRDDKRKLNDLCEQAIEAAKGSASATTGTALHALTELVDRGDELPPLPDSPKADLEAYRQAMSPLHVAASEQFVVCDEVQAAGTFDRIVVWQGRRYVADLKTGSIEWGIRGIAQQLAIYAHGRFYNPDTGERSPLDVDLNNALVIHLPQGEARCELVWVDVASGWEGVQLSAQVRAWRKRKGLTAPFQSEVAA